MTIRRVLSIGHPTLRLRAAEVPEADVAGDEVQTIIDDLIATMRHENGAGPTAPQIGEPRRIAVLDVADNPRYPYKPPIPLTVAINPVIEQLATWTEYDTFHRQAFVQRISEFVERVGS